MSEARTTIVWFRNDLRLADHPALQAAIAEGGKVIPVFIWAPEEEGKWPPGAASRWWLHHSLEALDNQLRELGSRLILRRGVSALQLGELARQTKARRVVWSRRYESAARERDLKVEQSLAQENIETRTFNGSLLFEPWEIKNRSGNPFRIFTAFWRTCLQGPAPQAPILAPRRPVSPKTWPRSLRLAELKLTPSIPWDAGFAKTWRPGCEAGERALNRFIAGALRDYSKVRNEPAAQGTSRLSPHLHFGEISPRQMWLALQAHAHSKGISDWRQSQFVAELGWREFAHHLLFHFPQTPEQPLRPEFKKFPWGSDARLLETWQQGRTGYPLVDAGMRELWTTGWMHNRVRMVVASFLTKNLLSPWQEGARWFWDTLVDADLANNSLGWQWTAGCGADAAPYFRVFNPVTQGEKFDPCGAYVRRWIPEIARLPDRFLQRPWEAPPSVLSEAGITLGRSYPEPVVNLFSSRHAALDAYARMRAG